MPPRFFRIGLLAACAAFCATAAVRPAMFRQSEGASRATPPETHPGMLLVFPFENDGRMASLDWLGEGLAELTVERLQDRGLSVLSRQERLAALEKIGLPDSARFSHATMMKIAAEADADEVVFGRFVSDGKAVTLEARVLRISPPWLSPAYTQTSSSEDLLRAHARLSWQILCALEPKNCSPQGANTDESSFADPPPSLRVDALENFVRGILAPDDESHIRALREAARVEPDWDRPPFELGQVYFARRDCESALPWFSRVPPNRPDGPEASFNTGVCHLLRNDAARAEAAFSGLIERTRSVDRGNWLPELSEVRNNLGVARLRLGKWSEAATEFERAAALDEKEPDYWVNLGIAKLAARQLAGAVAAFEHASKLDPDDKGARTLLISTLESLGRSSDAAAVRAESAENGGHAASPAPQDPAALARLARVSMKFDRALLRPADDAPAAHPSNGVGSQKRKNNGEHR
ncbi:MAG: tetratricopeptide repeat protein [Acidobacteriia bacterium]|nr:tetratricopeptide repeat protein [Terriglobia bacterium]